MLCSALLNLLYISLFFLLIFICCIILYNFLQFFIISRRYINYKYLNIVFWRLSIIINTKLLNKYNAVMQDFIRAINEAMTVYKSPCEP